MMREIFKNVTFPHTPEAIFQTMVKKTASENPPRETIEDLRKQNQASVDQLQRLQAEFENYQKRVEKEREKTFFTVHVHLLTKFLPLIDDFERAIASSPAHQECDRHQQGLELLHRQLYKILESEGVTPIHAVGRKFDPYQHEVIQRIPSDKEEDVIIKEIQKGYLLKNTILRHAKVIVSTGPEKMKNPMQPSQLAQEDAHE